MYQTIFQLLPRAPFEFDRALQFLGLFSPTQGDQTLAPHILTKALNHGDRAVVCRIESRGKVESPRLRITAMAAEPLDDAAVAALEARIRFFLSLDEDLQPLYDLAWQDAAFTPVAEQWYGYHQVKFLTPFETAVWAILSQRITMAQARNMKQALTRRFGPQLTLAGVVYWAFPAPAGIATADPAELAQLIGNERKAGYLHSAARAFHQVDEDWLRAAPRDEVRQWLLQIKGIGPWSADFILIRGLGHMERIDVGQEKRLMAAIRRVYGPQTSAAQAQEIADSYGEWQGYWAHYLRAAS